MCDGCAPMNGLGQPFEPTEGVKEDVRATKPHTVQVTLLVDAEDTGKAVSKVIGATAVGGIQVERISALPYEPEDDRW